MTGKLAAGSGPSVPPVVSITCLGSGLARGGAAGLRFNYARLSLDAVQVGPPFRTDYSTQPEAGGDPSERDRSEPKLGTKHVEAVVLIWQPAADWRHYQWCPTLAPRAFSHENRAEVSRVSVRDYSRIEQQRAPKSNRHTQAASSNFSTSWTEIYDPNLLTKSRQPTCLGPPGVVWRSSRQIFCPTHPPSRKWTRAGFCSAWARRLTISPGIGVLSHG